MNSRPFINSIRFLLVAYLTLVIKLVVLRGPLMTIIAGIRHEGLRLAKGFHTANFIPFKTLYYYLSLQENMETGIQNIGGNILLFIPLGILLPLAWKNFASPLRLLGAAFALSLLLETTQLLFALGNFDVDDLLLNILGALMGFVLYSRLCAIFPEENTLLQVKDH